MKSGTVWDWVRALMVLALAAFAAFLIWKAFSLGKDFLNWIADAWKRFKDWIANLSIKKSPGIFPSGTSNTFGLDASKVPDAVMNLKPIKSTEALSDPCDAGGVDENGVLNITICGGA